MCIEYNFLIKLNNIAETSNLFQSQDLLQQ